MIIAWGSIIMRYRQHEGELGGLPFPDLKNKPGIWQERQSSGFWPARAGHRRPHCGNAAKQNEMAESSTHNLIFVLGMHRSGTSALTRVLNLSGCRLHSDLTRSNQYNERGYWETLDVQKISDAVLVSAKSSWFDQRPVNLEALSQDQRKAFSEQIKGCLQGLFDQSGGEPGIIKDPRISRMFPLWEAAAREFGARISTVIMVRNPLEVAKSLAYRDKIGIEHSILLWLRHLLDAEKFTRSIPRSFVQFEQLLTQPGEQIEKIARELNRAWPNPWKDIESEVATFLSADLKHHQQEHEDLRRFGTIGDIALEALQHLSDLAEKGESSDARDAMDACARQLQECMRMPERYASEMISDHLAYMRSLGVLEPEVSDTLSAALHEGMLGAEAGIEATRARDKLHTEISHAQSLTERLEAAHGKLKKLGAAEQELKNQLASAEQELRDQRAQAARSAEELTSQTRKLEFTEMSWRLDAMRLEQAREEQKQRDLDVRRRDREIVALQKSKHEISQSLAKARAELAASQTESQRQTAEIAQLTSMIRDWQSFTDSGFGKWAWHWLRRVVQLGRLRAQNKDERLIRSSGLFDPEWYLATYPDLSGSGISPLRHFVRHGAMEGRNPSANFDCSEYRRNHPEAELQHVNPLAHAIRTGALDRDH